MKILKLISDGLTTSAVVMTDDGRFVELQGTAEHNPFTGEHLESMLALARKGLKRIFALTRR